MSESLVTQSILDRYGGAVHRRTPAGLIFARGRRKKLAVVRNHPVHVWQNGQIVPIDTRWQEGTSGEYGVSTLAPRIYPTINEVHMDGCSFCFQPYAVGTVTLDPLGFDLIATLPTGHLSGNQYIIEIGIYTYTLTLHERNRVKIDIELPEKPPNLSGDYFVIANKVLDLDFFKDMILEDNQTYKDVLMFNRGDAVDAGGSKTTVKNIVREIGGQQYLLSGIPIDWLDTAVYPVHIDPTVTLQPGSSGYDAYASETNSTTNYGSSTEMWAGTQVSDDRVFYLKFDLSSIEDYLAIVSATLTLYHSYNAGIDAETYMYLYRLRRDWQESTVCWAYYTGTTGWTTPPGTDNTNDRYAALTGERTLIPTSGSGVYRDYPCTASVESWLSGDVTNYGWMVPFQAGEATDGQRFDTSDHLTAVQRPEIEIEYIATGTYARWIT